MATVHNYQWNVKIQGSSKNYEYMFPDIESVRQQADTPDPERVLD